MSDEIIKDNEKNEEDNNPLAVRVDLFYKNLFNDLKKKKGFSKKLLMESMISHYYNKDRQDNREEVISFKPEISLISDNINSILEIFQRMAVKSQDTLLSLKDSLEQKIKNLETDKKTLETKVKEFQDRNTLLEQANNGFNLEREKLENIIKDLKDSLEAKEKDNKALNDKNSGLLEQINALRAVEKDNVVLRGEIENLNRENKKINLQVNEASDSKGILQNKVTALNNEIKEMKDKKAEEMKELEKRIRKEVELEKKAELLEAKTQYNTLQAENLKNLNTINKLNEENSSLSKEVAEFKKVKTTKKNVQK